MSQAACATSAKVPVEQLAGHVVLAKMGKKLLRPGGRRATEELSSLAGLHPGDRVCEIATNRAVTAIELARRYDVSVDGMDSSGEFLSLAERNVAERGLGDRVRPHLGNGRELPFEDGTFDAVLAEAVITMLPPGEKAETLAEAARVLRPGGRLVFHEPSRTEEAPTELRQGLVKAIRHAAWPLTLAEWEEFVEDAGLEQVDVRAGPVSLLSPRGLLRDEGFGGVIRIGVNVLRTRGAPARFRTMAGFFRRHRPLLR
ncbi:MAG: class I SAM-dependent methyltransferase [Phycisphaerae bacterium]|jgi:cyclopropane fatty-acyl-phospholipid synthase-like methyltransferase